MKKDIYSLIKDNEGLIYSIASKYSNYYNLEDLYQAGSIGIIKAYKNYNSNSDVKFSTYVYKYIMGEIISFIRNDRNIKVNDEYINIYKKYLSVKNLLTTKYNRIPSFSEICLFMEISEEYLLNIIETISFTISSDSNLFEYSGYIDERERIDTGILIENELEKFSSFDRELIDYRYYEGYTQSETASLLGVSQVKVSREEKLILQKLRDKIKA